MLELGKRDLLGRGYLSMLPFAHNRSFFGIDVALVAVTDPDSLLPYLRLIVELLQEKKIFPLAPVTNFEAKDMAEAFRYMQKGVHVGRISVRMPEHATQLASIPSHRKTMTIVIGLGCRSAFVLP